MKTDRIKKNGCAAIYLQVIINRTVKKIGLDLEWPVEKFSEKDLCKHRQKVDADANDYNIIIRDGVSKVNEIFKYFRLTNQVLTPAILLDEYHNPLSKTDFILFMEQKIKERYNLGYIMNGTKKNHNNTLKKLKGFSKTIHFFTFNEDFADKFDRYLKVDCKLKTPNGRWGHHRDVKTYLEFARKKKIKFVDPYMYFSNKSTPGKWKAIPLMELNQLLGHYREMPDSIEKDVLQRFLFGCFTGLRLSDQKRIEKSQIIDNTLVFVPYKTRHKGKILIYPLTTPALEVLNDALAHTDRENIFADISDQYGNRVLKDIGKQLGISCALHHHAGRETFGTNFIAMGGSVTTLQKYFDHFNISTTMKYVHESQNRINEDVSKMNDLFAGLLEPANT